jgi:hypothetical protein
MKTDSTNAIAAYGGDPMQPNDVMLERIAAVADGGEKDEAVDRWAAAFKATCPEPVTADAILLDKLADSVLSGEKDDDALKNLLASAAEPVLPVAHRLAALKEKKLAL